ncbi:MAG: type II toxin-antitoxin system Phd/YefM family antitoxin [Spirochaetales bacterium]|nr:type II toxin-antitoxin system Phd/YefM family antitoxin [Spirochaetales bacterium]
MNRIILDEDIHSVSDFRANANNLLKQVKKTKRPIVLTQHGKSYAVVLDVSEYEYLLEEIELLRDIRNARKEIQEGKGIPHDNVYDAIMEKFKK